MNGRQIIECKSDKINIHSHYPFSDMHTNYTIRKLRVAALLITIFQANLMSGSHNTRLKLMTSLDPAETLGKGGEGQFQELREIITLKAIVIK